MFNCISTYCCLISRTINTQANDLCGYTADKPLMLLHWLILYANDSVLLNASVEYQQGARLASQHKNSKQSTESLATIKDSGSRALTNESKCLNLHISWSVICNISYACVESARQVKCLFWTLQCCLETNKGIGPRWKCLSRQSI